MAGLQHPNIVQIHEVGDHEEHAYLSLEFLDGGSLAERLDGTPMAADKAARLAETLARAMEHARKACQSLLFSRKRRTMAASVRLN